MKLRTRITLTLSLAVTCIVAVVGATIYAVAREGLRAQVQLRVSHLATGMRDRLESGMRERVRDLRNVAALEASLAGTPNALRPALARLQASHAAYAWIGLVDSAGQVLASGSDARAVAAGETRLVPAAAPAQAASGSFGEIVVPVADGDGRRVGALVAHITLSWVRTLAEEVLHAGGVQGAAELLVVRPDRKVLLGPAELRGRALPERLLNDLALDYVEGDGGDGRTYAMAGSAARDGGPAGGWRVIARIDRATAYAPLGRMATLLAYLGLGAIALGSLGAWIFAARLARPMERWVAAADRIGVGDLDVEFPAADGSYEARRLSAALKSMTQRLAEKEDALQARIDERTSQLVAATRELEVQRERLAYALEGSRLALFDLDAKTGRVLLSAEWARMVGSPEGETVTTVKALAECVPLEDHALLYEAAIGLLKGRVPQYDVEHRFVREDGSVMWIRSRCHVTERAPNGRALRATGTNADITARKTVERMLQHQALTDLVTDLPNRRHFGERLAQAVAKAQREDSVLALLYADLDGFKAINDAYGHAAGDELLRQVGARFVACVRASDTVARVGGDEFAVLLDTAASREGANEVAEKLIHALHAPLDVGGAQAPIACSIGIALYPAHGADAPALLQAADAAMYRAKSAGKGRYAWSGVAAATSSPSAAARQATAPEAERLRDVKAAGSPARG